ncbi:MAG: glycosyltransferase [Deltaproteobacteria bacterium]|nr:glycosyltransferase [Deltaproteobacteria bacterium]
MRLALFTPYLPEPPMTGGRIRAHHLATALCAAHEVHLFATASRTELAQAAVKDALQMFASYHVRPAPFAFMPGFRHPARVRNGVTGSAMRAFARLHAARAFDAIWVEHVHAARVASSAGLPWLLDEHNIESAYLRDRLAARGPLSTRNRREVARLEKWEQSQWRTATQVVCVTTADAERVRKTREKAPIIIPNGVDLSKIRFRPPSERTGANILFVGLMNHPPNERAALMLVEEIMPRVWASRPDARLVLCGANPSRLVRGLKSERVDVTGTVESVGPYLDEARAYAFPLFHGAGSSLKLLEALAAGVPLVATRVGVRGFDVRPETHYLAAEDGETFATALLQALAPADVARADTRAAAARALTEAYDWKTLAGRFANAIDQLRLPLAL